MGIRGTGFSFDGLGRQLRICEVATRFVSEGISLAGRDQSDTCTDMGTHQSIAC